MSRGSRELPGPGLDTVELGRIERLLAESDSQDVGRLFTEAELKDAGEGPQRVPRLAARFAAKEACCKLFPRELALGMIGPADFSVRRDAYGAPRVEVSRDAQYVLDRRCLAGISVSLTHTDASASAIATAQPRMIDVPWFGRMLYHLAPFRRRVVLDNLRRVFGDVLGEEDIQRLAQAYCAHFARFLVEFARMPFMSDARRKAWVRVENAESAIRAQAQGKGLLLLTGHFGNWEVATVIGMRQFPQYRGALHVVRRPLKPALLNAFVNRRFQRSGFGTLPKRGSLQVILDLLAEGAVLVYVLDQHAGGNDGVVVDFLGQPAGTFKSLAVLALHTGAPVVPVCGWREPDGRHVLRFEDPVPLIECDDPGEAIRRNTQSYSTALERMLLRHPEQWIWMHRRWKAAAASQVTPAPAS
ncbi:MAG TPA: 4'-phosphopantetheinyl transferase superfamily protein [Candidatus Acidoferrum sp.]|nr:4'-phosphopantetheinyl transferase superfamily protein [Candidatus Acidoferrum sp.]